VIVTDETLVSISWGTVRILFSLRSHYTAFPDIHPSP